MINISSDKKERISPYDVSVIVQGSINKSLIRQSLASVRKFLKGAEIILSTWENSQVEGLDYDKLVINKDPGFCYYDDIAYFPSAKVNNLNRQIVSTKNAISSCSKAYILKLRSDFEICGSKFLKTFQEDSECKSSSLLFNRRVVVISYISRPDDLLFFPCDWAYFGLSEDINDLFSIPLVDQVYAEWFKYNKPVTPILYERYRGNINRFPPEMYIFYSFVSKKRAEVRLMDFTDIRLRDESIKIMSANLLVYGYEQFPIRPLKKELMDSFKLLNKKNNGYWLQYSEWKKIVKASY